MQIQVQEIQVEIAVIVQKEIPVEVPHVQTMVIIAFPRRTSGVTSIGVNKMDFDTVGYAQDHYDEIANEIKYMFGEARLEKGFHCEKHVGDFDP